MRKFLGVLGRMIFVGVVIAGFLFQPQYRVLAAPVLTVKPVTWNVIGLDSNDVTVGPNNFPIGVRVCNTGDTPATNVTATFAWDSTNANINLRSGSLNPIVLSNLPNGACSDFYFEIVVARTAAAYDTTRWYHVNITADGLNTTSTPSREIYVEHLVSQHRNSVLDIHLNGVSIATGGTMNLLVGNTYTITLESSTATNGYEQIETFIYFPNTIFQVLSVTTTFTADGGTDPDAATKLYADGCAWNNVTRACTGTGKYGGNVTVNYVVKIISVPGPGDTGEALKTLIYDYSGSSYHYNTDYDDSGRLINIIDPSVCVQQPITSWQYNVNADTTNPTNGAGTFVSSGLANLSTSNDGNPARSLSSEDWPAGKSTSDFLEYRVSTVGYYAIHFNFEARYNNGGGGGSSFVGPNTFDVGYSTTSVPAFTDFATNQTVTSVWGAKTNNLTNVANLSNNANARFRIYAYNADANDQLRVDNVTITGCALPAAINIEKAGVINQTIVAPSDQANVGDQVDYTIIVANTGGIPLTNVILTDTKAQSLTCTPSLAGLTLQPGQSVTCTGFHTLTQQDFDTGSVTNIATADSDQVGPVSDSTTQNLPQSPALTLDKIANLQIYTAIDQQVIYTYTLTNTGNVTLTSPYSVTDNKVTVDCSAATSPLLPGQATTCTATYTITAQDIQAGSVTNLATANATFGNTIVTSNPDNVTINYAGLNIFKEVSSNGIDWNDASITVNVGSTVYYRIRVQNTGNVALTGFVVDDGMAGCTLTRGTDSPGNNDQNFDAGETWVYTCSVTAEEGLQNNTATADSNETEPVSDVAAYFGANPALSIVKSESGTGPYSVGKTINYNIIVTNTGNVVLNGVTVTDTSAIVGTCTPAQPATLALGASMTCPASHVVTQGDVDNGSYINTATGDSNETPPSSSTVTVNFSQDPSLGVLKTQTSSGPYKAGDTILYNIVATNNGNITLTNVIISDDNAILGTCTPAQPATLTPGETLTCSASHLVTQDDVNNGNYINTATADSQETPPSNSTVTVTFSRNPSLSVLKAQISSGPYVVNDTITYNIVVTNIGNTTLTGVTVQDNNATLGTCTPEQPAILNPGENMACPASHSVTQDDVDNGSYVNTATADSTETPPSSSTVTVTFTPAPAMSIVKSVTETSYSTVGTTLHYSYLVTNTGNVTLNGPFTITDDKSTDEICPVTIALAPDASITCTATYRVLQADLNAGSITNIASAHGSYKGTTVDSLTDTETVPATQEPDIRIVKSSDATGTNAAGETITYSYDVENIGNVTLTNVTVTDDHADLSAITCTPAQGATLDPGNTMTCTAAYIVKQTDVNAGQINNTGVVIGTPPSGPNVTDSDPLSEPVRQAPAITIVKSSNASGANTVGEVITYTYDVENTGNLTLTNVIVTDDHAGLSAITCTPAQGSTLTPRDTMTCHATYSVTQVDVNAGKINNTGVVTGVPPSGQNVTDSDNLTVNVAQNPQLGILKSQTSTGPYFVGDTITYSIVVTNTGNTTLNDVTVTDNNALLGSCTPDQPAILAPGAKMTCSASHEVTEGDVESRSYENTATADSNETPPSDSTVKVNFGVADLSLVKTVTNTTPVYLTNINFIITVTNGGPEAATGVEVTERMPTGFTFISSSTSKGTYNSSTAIWTIGDLAINQSVTLTLTVRVNESGTYTNTAEVSASRIIDPDSTPDNLDPNEDDQSSVTVQPRTGSQPPKPTPTPVPTKVPAIGGEGFLIPVTGFSPGVASDMSRVPYAAYSDTSVKLEIPALSVNIPIVGVPKKGETWNVSWLANQAGWLEGSAFPSWKGNSVLTSHVYLSNGKPGPFAKLHELKTGDQVIVHAFGQKYIFEVQSNKIVAPNDKSVMKHEENPWLTLVTCTDYDAKTDTYKNRFIVRAVLVKVSVDK